MFVALFIDKSGQEKALEVEMPTAFATRVLLENYYKPEFKLSAVYPKVKFQKLFKNLKTEIYNGPR